MFAMFEIIAIEPKMVCTDCSIVPNM